MSRPIINEPFSAIDWIRCRYASSLRYLHLDAQPLLHFALIWNIFESELCESSINVAKLRALSTTLAASGFTNKLAFVRFNSFVKGKYVNNGALMKSFDALRIRTSNDATLVANALLGTTSEAADAILALLLIVYRYRNNVFHGLKEVGDIFGSVQLFDESARFLAGVIEAE